jgi:predicted membrane-bound mannosyltransferase
MHTAAPAAVTTEHPLAASRSRLPLHLLVACIVLTALALRLYGLGTYGFSEDEVAKLQAIDAYRHGDFSANGEHPMLMKLAMWASLAFAERWNDLAPSMAISPEAALRLPNVIAGAATTLAVYGVGALLLGPAAGIVAAFFVAVDPTTIAINRLGKEDTLLVLFFLLAVWCYEKGKRIGAAQPQRAQPWYTAAGACFGLMLASKYMPHLFGLYALFNVAAEPNPGPNKPDKLRYHAAMAAAFLAANFAVLMPSTWSYAASYVRGATSTHHGYLYDGALYVNAASVLLWGVPWTYYLRLILTKVPLAIIAGMLAGTVLLFTRRNVRGFVWLRVLVVIQLFGYAVFAAKFQRYALPLLIVLYMLSAAGLVAAGEWYWRRRGRGAVGAPLSIVAAAVGCVALAMTPIGVAPYYSIYRNSIGTGQGGPATVYPEEAYDYGVREAVREVAAVAGPGAAIVSDAALVVEHYVARGDRNDLEVRSLSRDGLRPRGEQWILVQDSHVYFENASLLDQLRRTHVPWREYRLGGTSVLQVFKVVL